MNNPIQSVLVATDFSDVSLNAVQTAAGICQRHGAALRILHVVTSFGVAVPPLGHYAMVGTYLSELQSENHERLASLAAETGQQWGIVCTADEAMGAVDDAVAGYAAEHRCDLVVMGTQGAKGLGKFFLGNNAISVLKRAPCPVLAVPEGVKATEFRNILFPVRAVPQATDKYDFLRPIIARNGATLHVAGIAAVGNPDRFMYVNALTSQLSQQLKSDGVDFTLEKHYCPDVADTVIYLASKRNADLLVVTATLEKDFWDFFSGPFSKKMLDHAGMAVLMVRPGTEGEQNAKEPLEVVSAEEVGNA